MAKTNQMVAVSVADNPINKTDKYHRGISAALTVQGIEVIITAKTEYDLNFAASKLMGSRCFNVDFTLVKETATFGVVAGVELPDDELKALHKCDDCEWVGLGGDLIEGVMEFCCCPVCSSALISEINQT